MKISFDIEIAPEEILSLVKAMEDKIAKESVDIKMHTPADSIAHDSWNGKSVRIKKTTPDSEIESWKKKLERDIIYGVTEQMGPRDIRIQNIWYPKIWFELVG